MADGPHHAFPVGSTGRFVLNSHCGVEFETIDQVTWRTEPHGDGNMPPWPEEAFTGTLSRPEVGVAVFTSGALPGGKLIYRLAPEITWICA